MSRKKTRSSFKKVFFAGLLVTLPLAFTFFLLQFLFIRIDNLLGPAITLLLIKAGMPLGPEFRIPGLGIIVTVLIIYLIGLFTRSIVGRTVVRLYEAVLVRIPVLKNIYVGAKQVIETFGSSMGGSFNKVVMIEYPRKGIYALAFVTSTTTGEAVRLTGKEMVNVFLPTTPNPTSGFYLLIPKEDIIEMDTSVEGGIKMIISGGLVTPPDPIGEKQQSGENVRVEKPEFQNRIITEPLSRDELKRMARRHDGVIKVVVDIKKNRLAAGAKWHNESRDLLVESGSSSDDCWGIKLDIYSGEIAYKSQINKGKPNHDTEEIKEVSVREKIKALVEKYLPA